MATSSSMIRIRCPVSMWKGGGVAEMASVASDMRGFPQHGKFEIKGGSGADVTFHVYLSGVLLNDAVSNGKAQARTTPFSLLRRRLGCKERIIDTLQMLWRNARAGIGNGHADVPVDLRRNAQRPAVFHRILRVQKEIQKDLLQFAGITQNGRQVGHQRSVQPYLRCLELVFYQRQSISNDGVQVRLAKLRTAGA